MLAVSDDGHGSDTLNNIFETLFTTKAKRNCAKAIIEALCL